MDVESTFKLLLHLLGKVSVPIDKRLPDCLIRRHRLCLCGFLTPYHILSTQSPMCYNRYLLPFEALACLKNIASERHRKQQQQPPTWPEFDHNRSLIPSSRVTWYHVTTEKVSVRFADTSTDEETNELDFIWFVSFPTLQHIQDLQSTSK